MLPFSPNNNHKTYRACIYARKSNDDGQGGTSNSVKDQMENCLAVIQREGWELVRDGDSDSYIDEGITGRAWPAGQDYEAQAAIDDFTNEVLKNQPKSKQRRPAFGRMLDDMKAGKIDVVVVRDMPRLARPVFQSMFSVFLPTFFPKHNTSLYSINDGFIDYREFSRSITLMLTDAMVDRELRIRAGHSRKAIEAQKNAGNYLGGKAIFGYDLINGELVPNQDAKSP